MRSSPAKNSSTSFAIGAAPLTQTRARPSPSAGLSFEKTSRFASAYWSAEQAVRLALAVASLRSITRCPTPIAQSASTFLTPVAWPSFALMPAWNFSQMRGTPKNTVGCTSLRLSGTFSIDSAKYTAAPVVLGTWIVNICSAMCDSGR